MHPTVAESRAPPGPRVALRSLLAPLGVELQLGRARCLFGRDSRVLGFLETLSFTYSFESSWNRKEP